MTKEEGFLPELLFFFFFIVTKPLILPCKLRQHGGVAEGKGKTKLGRRREQNRTCLEPHLRVVLSTCPKIQAVYSMKDTGQTENTSGKIPYFLFFLS